MNTLVATVGLPRSGKSTRVKALSFEKGWPIVNPDSVRLAIHGQRYLASAEPFVWATTKAMVQALFFAGHDTVILDATNVRKQLRDNWRTIGASNNYFVRFLNIPTDAAECLRRAAAEDDNYIVPVIHKMAAEFEPLDESEPRWGNDWRIDYVR